MQTGRSTVCFSAVTNAVQKLEELYFFFSRVQAQWQQFINSSKKQFAFQTHRGDDLPLPTKNSFPGTFFSLC